VKGNIVQAVVVLLPCVSFRVQNRIVAFFESFFFLEKKNNTTCFQWTYVAQNWLCILVWMAASVHQWPHSTQCYSSKDVEFSYKSVLKFIPV